MITTILFVLSMVACIQYSIIMISVIAGNVASIPIPILHHFDISFANSWISISAIAFQVYFWFSYMGVIS